MRDRKPLEVDGQADARTADARTADARMADARAAEPRALRPDSPLENPPENPPENSGENPPEARVGAEEIRRAALGQGFASDGRRRRSLHTATVAFKVRPGIPDLLEDICYLRRLKKQELFEEMLAAWLDAADTPELAAKYRRITGRRTTDHRTMEEG